MYTSYFHRLDLLPGNVVSICGKAPIWYTGPQYKILAPKYWFFKEYKDSNISADEYTKHYYEEVLNKLNPEDTYTKLWSAYGKDCTLLCYEKPNEFCHRHIVAEWFNNHFNKEVIREFS